MNNFNFKYIRVSHKTEIDIIKDALFDKKYWNLKYPKLVISVTGGARLKQTKLIKNIFCKGLVKLAASTRKLDLYKNFVKLLSIINFKFSVTLDAWITTGGTDAGIMKYVAEASKDNMLARDKIVLLGIANWCTITHKETLVKKEDVK